MTEQMTLREAIADFMFHENTIASGVLADVLIVYAAILEKHAVTLVDVATGEGRLSDVVQVFGDMAMAESSLWQEYKEVLDAIVSLRAKCHDKAFTYLTERISMGVYPSQMIDWVADLQNLTSNEIQDKYRDELK